MKIVLYAAFVVSIFFIKNVSVFIVIVFLVFILLVRLPFQVLIRGWLPIGIFMSFTFVSNLFFQYGRIIYSMGPLFITEEGIASALLRTMRLFCMIAGAKILTATTGVEPLVNGFKNLLKPLERTGLPVEEFFSTMGITMRSLPHIKEQVVGEYRLKVKEKEIEGVRNRARAISAFLLPLILKSIQSPELFLREKVENEISVESRKETNDS